MARRYPRVFGSAAAKAQSRAAFVATGGGTPPGPVVLARPAELNLDPAMWPFTFTRQTDGVVTTDFDPLIWAPAPRLGDAGIAVFYADGARPVDTGDGLTPATAKRQISSAIVAGNNQALPFVVVVSPGTYPRALCPSSTTGLVAPNKRCTLIVNGPGQVVAGLFDALTWAVDQGTTYVAARSVARRVINRLLQDANGIHPDITYATSLANCRATPGTWWTDNVNVYVNRIDGLPVTDANTRVFLNVNGNAAPLQMSTGGNMHVIGDFEFQGGTPIRLSGSPANRFYGQGFKARYSSGNDGVVGNGAAASLNDCIAVLDIAGAVFRNVDASAAQKDGFNAHILNAVRPFMATIDCTGRNNGRGPAGRSCNGLTTHDGCKAIDVRGFYQDNAGGQVAIVNDDTQLWCIDTWCDASRGDMIFGGAVPPSDFLVDQGLPTLFLDSCRSTNTQYSLNARFGRILTRGGAFAGETFTANGGTVGAIG